jgi:TctA family transporter
MAASLQQTFSPAGINCGILPGTGAQVIARVSGAGARRSRRWRWSTTSRAS